MKTRKYTFSFGLLFLTASILLSLMTSAPASAQDRQYADNYDITENSQVGHGDTDNGPVRMARFSYIHGNVTWRPDSSAAWSTASINLPLRQGAQIWVTDGGRAEIALDDGSQLRLGNNAIATLQTLYSDSEGEFTEIKLNDGLASLRLKHEHSVYQVDTPFVSVKATGPAKIRIGAGDGVEVGVREGQATVEGSQGKISMKRGDYLDLRDINSPYDLRNLPREDNWEQWNSDRDQRLLDADRSYQDHHLAPNIALSASDLDSYGDWRTDSQYGSVWCPRISNSSWRPYHDGRWTWCDPYGWTWVSEEPWGWAPYHYGTWVHASYGWGWCPGPYHQYWSPAVVNFSEYGGNIAWCPLSPYEVRYPSTLSIGFRGGDWSLFFGIGCAGVYYPSNEGFFSPYRFNNNYVNHVTYINNTTNIYNNNNNNNNRSFDRFSNSSESFAANHNNYFNGRAIVPGNSRFGVSTASINGFGGRGSYTAVTGSGASLFQRGRSTGAPSGDHAPQAGPIAVKPSRESITPGRTFSTSAQPGANMMNRQVYRSIINPSIARTSAPFTGNRSSSTGQGGLRQPTISNDKSTRANTGANTYTRQPVNTGRSTSGSIGGSTSTSQSGSPVRGRSDSQVRPGGNTADTSVNSTRRDPQVFQPTRGRDSSTGSGSSSAADTARRARESIGFGGSRSRSTGSETSGGSSRNTDNNRSYTPSVGSGRASNGSSSDTTRNRANDTQRNTSAGSSSDKSGSNGGYRRSTDNSGASSSTGGNRRPSDSAGSSSNGASGSYRRSSDTSTQSPGSSSGGYRRSTDTPTQSSGGTPGGYRRSPDNSGSATGGNRGSAGDTGSTSGGYRRTSDNTGGSTGSSSGGYRRSSDSQSGSGSTGNGSSGSYRRSSDSASSSNGGSSRSYGGSTGSAPRSSGGASSGGGRSTEAPRSSGSSNSSGGSSRSGSGSSSGRSSDASNSSNRGRP